MAIIAIARELAAFGEETAQELARITGYAYLDKEFLERKLKNLSPEKLEQYDEKNPGFWASLSQQREKYLHFLKIAILEGAHEGNCIILGRGAASILREAPSMFSVKITAPLAIRVERIKKLHGCDRKRALQIIEQSDHDRSGFHKYFFSEAWDDPREYDVTFNTAKADPAHAAVAIDALRKVYIDKEKEEAGEQKISNLLAGARIATAISYQHKIPIHFLEVDVTGSQVLLQGIANSQNAIDNAMSVAQAMPGVHSVESAIQLANEFPIMS